MDHSIEEIKNKSRDHGDLL